MQQGISSSTPDQGSPLLDTRDRISMFRDRLLISAGTLKLAAPRSGAAPLHKGLKVVVILSGRERMRLEGHPSVEIDGPQACVVLNNADGGRNEHWVSPDVPLRFALVQMDPTLVYEEIGIDIDALISRGSSRPRRTLVHLSPASAVLQSLASQMVACPIQ